MKPGDRVKVGPACRSLVAPKGMLGRLEESATHPAERRGFLSDSWLVRLDNRDLCLLWEDELQPADEPT